MDEPTTDAEKIEWLWDRLDSANSKNASLHLALEVTETKLETSVQENEKLRKQIMQMAKEVSDMAVELNKARQSAANSVREYVAATEV